MKAFIAGVVIWVGATSFFKLFGERVLLAPSDTSFLISFVLLEFGTAVALVLLTLLYRRWDTLPSGLLRFGIVGSTIGLTLDAISLSNHVLFFPNLSSEQLISFAIWMSFAYALYLAIPSIMYLQSRPVKIVDSQTIT